jgi:hypothetical protein
LILEKKHDEYVAAAYSLNESDSSQEIKITLPTVKNLYARD